MGGAKGKLRTRVELPKPLMQGTTTMNDAITITPASLTSTSLIAADKVTGTSVYNLAGEKLGSVDNIMIDKASGRAIYAVMSFGGFLGMGEGYHALPWSTLKYSHDKGGYVVDLDKDRLTDAPVHDGGEDFMWTPEYGRRVDGYYNAPMMWF